MEHYYVRTRTYSVSCTGPSGPLDEPKTEKTKLREHEWKAAYLCWIFLLREDGTAVGYLVRDQLGLRTLVRRHLTARRVLQVAHARDVFYFSGGKTSCCSTNPNSGTTHNAQRNEHLHTAAEVSDGARKKDRTHYL